MLETAYALFVEQGANQRAIGEPSAEEWRKSFVLFLGDLQRDESQEGRFEEVDPEAIYRKYEIVESNGRRYLASSRYVRNRMRFRFSIRDDGLLVRLKEDGSEHWLYPQNQSVDSE